MDLNFICRAGDKSSSFSVSEPKPYMYNQIHIFDPARSIRIIRAHLIPPLTNVMFYFSAFFKILPLL